MILTESQSLLSFSGLSAVTGRRPATGKAPSKEEMEALAKLMEPAVPTAVFSTYWQFACERQAIFFRRFAGQAGPWTEDPILAEHRFTNAYRVTDRVSQYLVRKVQAGKRWSEADLFLRTILFKFFNRIDTWQLLVEKCGEPQWANFSTEKYGSVLDDAMAAGKRIYSAAYIMPSGGPNSGHKKKHRMHLALLKRMMEEGLPARIAKEKTMKGVFGLLRGYPTIGDFLAYQYAIDLNYSTLTNHKENDFVVPGPGAREGIEKCFSDLGGKDLTWVIEQVTSKQGDAFRALGLSFQDLWGRPLKLIDCQNLFCEVAKYARVRHPEFNGPTGRSRIKQKFSALSDPIVYMFPEKYDDLAAP